MSFKISSALAAVLCLVFEFPAGQLQAGVVVGNVNQVVQRVAGEDIRTVDFGGVAANAIQFRVFPADLNSPLFVFGVEVFSSGSTEVLGMGTVSNLAANNPIDGGANWLISGIAHGLHSSNGGSSGPFSNDALGYLGVRFLNSNTNQINYGWISYTADTSGGSGTIHQWGFENSGAGIAAGQLSAIPEPTAFLLVGSVMAWGMLRRRRV